MAVTHGFPEAAEYDVGWRRQVNQQARVKVASLLFTELSEYYRTMPETQLKDIAASSECEAFYCSNSLREYLGQIAQAILEAKKCTQELSAAEDQQAEQVDVESVDGSNCTAAME